jgi:SAM-dependent methyltransferase
MKTRGYTNTLGVTLSPGDIKICTDKGHKTKGYDLSFLPVQDGYIDESVDFIFLRHALEHSPYPIISLIEYNRILKQGAKIYIEVPAPDGSRRHEWNLNHYSILGSSQLAALLHRTGFDIDSFNNFEFDLNLGRVDAEGKPIVDREKYYCIVATKKRPLDLK